jgi:uncharacterized phage-associated protein
VVNTPPFDARSVANAILSFAEEYNFAVTQLSLQKIVYFTHGRFLTERGHPLVQGAFEAWPYGPVHPLLYESFKASGAHQITERANRKDIMSGSLSVVEEPRDSSIRLFIRETAAQYLKLTPGRLVDLSHAPRSPWDVATQSDEGSRKYGMRIPNEMIRDLFKYHKISVGVNTRIGEPNEESLPS